MSSMVISLPSGSCLDFYVQSAALCAEPPQGGKNKAAAKAPLAATNSGASGKTIEETYQKLSQVGAALCRLGMQVIWAANIAGAPAAWLVTPRTRNATPGLHGSGPTQTARPLPAPPA